jgi:hypothetical protein
MKNYSLHVNILYAHTKFWEKHNIFYGLCKKDKKYCHVNNLLILNFIYLHMTQKLSVFHRTTLWTHSVEMYVLKFWSNFFFDFKDVFKAKIKPISRAKT